MVNYGRTKEGERGRERGREGEGGREGERERGEMNCIFKGNIIMMNYTYTEGMITILPLFHINKNSCRGFTYKGDSESHWGTLTFIYKPSS